MANEHTWFQSDPLSLMPIQHILQYKLLTYHMCFKFEFTDDENFGYLQESAFIYIVRCTYTDIQAYRHGLILHIYVRCTCIDSPHLY